MDRFYLKKAQPSDDSNGTQWDLALQVYVNDKLLDDDDYCLDIDSFFLAAEGNGSLTLVGGCGVPECCAVGPRSVIRDDGWEWRYGKDNVYRISWNDIYQAAKSIIEEIEQQENPHLKKHFTPRLSSYSKTLKHLEELIAGSNR